MKLLRTQTRTESRVFSPISSEIVSAEDFLDMTSRTPEIIGSSSFIPPRLGGRGLGSFNVSYSHPILRPIKL